VSWCACFNEAAIAAGRPEGVFDVVEPKHAISVVERRCEDVKVDGEWRTIVRGDGPECVVTGVVLQIERGGGVEKRRFGVQWLVPKGELQFAEIK